ncbi:fumarate reductase cytochrome b subunit [Helicobacter fennelliae]|mgnify:CR=1 FL=1|uniref:Fumarate reductase cytochrome b subunit n=2 Tax=Helicobacter fennelliae TaxID=215 RepID=T1CNB3_9HELI|nr:fumarate reductase cytochrome b subunit [Helicobacter fennelliae]GAD18279.1 fumarate reductase cytochrome b subunit [Helicobacter fennelliae MRY12-0050]SQB97875.1 fumarate reductase cytochrome b-556 subunit [Helicobacter fennelliae]STP06844.1 fumarate reductase cytochrome b-556 subunit [Helicobacter fennelliae]STQ83606.1 fumarate reductase cytochrome b-556 subunit [Helicobacter fennelliae]
MQDERIIESYTGVTPDRKKSRIPAKLDFWQSATGLFLALFMLVHLLFVSSILISKEAMFWVTKFFEGSIIFGDEGQPILVSIIAAIVIIAFVSHAFLALRKFPINYRQFIALKTHKKLMKHGDTSLWVIQAATGFAMFFLAMPHLFTNLTQPENIGPLASSFRFVQQHFWVLYIFLLFAVELHGSIGLYRLCIKWGWFEKLGITNLRRIKWVLSVFCIVLGLCSFAAYIQIGKGLDVSKGIEHYRAVDVATKGKGE